MSRGSSYLGLSSTYKIFILRFTPLTLSVPNLECCKQYSDWSDLLKQNRNVLLLSNKSALFSLKKEAGKKTSKYSLVNGGRIWKRSFDAQLSIKPHFHPETAEPVNVVEFGSNIVN